MYPNKYRVHTNIAISVVYLRDRYILVIVRSETESGERFETAIFSGTVEPLEERPHKTSPEAFK